MWCPLCMSSLLLLPLAGSLSRATGSSCCGASRSRRRALQQRAPARQQRRQQRAPRATRPTCPCRQDQAPPGPTTTRRWTPTKQAPTGSSSSTTAALHGRRGRQADVIRHRRQACRHRRRPQRGNDYLWGCRAPHCLLSFLTLDLLPLASPHPGLVTSGRVGLLLGASPAFCSSTTPLQ